MKKTLALILTLVLCMTMFAGCQKEKTNETVEIEEVTTESDETAQVTPAETSSPVVDDTTIHIAALKGPTAMGMVKLMDDSKKGTASINCDFKIAPAVDEIAPLLVKGEVDIAAVPANLASVLYNNTKGGVEVLAINTLGVLYIVESGNTIQSVADLKGKTIYSSGKGATPEYTLNYILKENGIDPEKDVTIEYKSEHTECVALLSKNKDAIAMLPQPFVTVAQSKNDKIRVALDMNKEWDSLLKDDTKSALVTGAIVVRKEFLDQHKDLVNAFMDSYKESVDFVNSNVEEAATMIGNEDIVPAGVAKIAIPYCNIVFIEGEEMKAKLNGYYSVLHEQNPKSVGGTMPDDAFYYTR